MKTQKLEEKLVEEKNKKTALEANTFEAEINAEVAEYRKSVVAKYREQKAVDIAKLESRIDILTALITEDKEAEKAAAATITATTPATGAAPVQR